MTPQWSGDYDALVAYRGLDTQAGGGHQRGIGDGNTPATRVSARVSKRADLQGALLVHEGTISDICKDGSRSILVPAAPL